MKGQKFITVPLLIIVLAIILPFQQGVFANGEAISIGNQVNVRSAPSLDGLILGQLKKGEKVNVIESGEKWTKITFNKKEGFVSSQFLQVLHNEVEEKKEQKQEPVRKFTVEIIVNNEKLELSFEPPNEDNSLLVPFRLIAEAIDIKVDWLSETKQVVANDQGKEVVFTLYEEATLVDGEVILVKPSPKVVNQSTVIPLRFFAETFGAQVNWVAETQTVEIFRQKQKPPISIGSSSYVAKVNASTLNMRSGPSIDEPIVTRLILGETVQVEEFENEWLKVYNDTFIGYVHGGYVQLFSDDNQIKVLGNPVFTVSESREMLSWYKYGGVNTTFKRAENQITIKTDSLKVYPIEVEADFIDAVTFEKTDAGFEIVIDVSTKYRVNFTETFEQISVTITPSGLEGKKIIIDAGHGGKDPGAVANDLLEKEINLDVSLRLQSLLENAGVEVILTREDDTFLELSERVSFANGLLADSFISIHANAATNTQANGTETYWNATYSGPESLLLAERIQFQLLEKLGTFDRKVKEGNYQVIRGTQIPSVLIELGFVTNKVDAKKLANDQFRQNAAEAIFQGLQQFYE